MLWDALDKWVRNRPDSEMLNAVWKARNRGSYSGNICSNRDVHKHDRQGAALWFSSSPISVFVTQERVGEIYQDFNALLQETELSPSDLNPTALVPKKSATFST